MKKRKGRKKSNKLKGKGKKNDENPTNPIVLEKKIIDSSPNGEESTKAYEIVPIIQYSSEGKGTDIIEPSRKLTTEELNNIIDNKNDKLDHIHPTIVKGYKDLSKEIAKKNEKKKNKHVFRKRVCYLLIWLYFLFSILIINPDAYFVVNFLDFSIFSYLIFRILIISSILMIIWKRVGNKRLWKTVGEFFLFPFYPGLWAFIKSFAYYIPRNFIKTKSFYLLFVYLEVVIGCIFNFKTKALSILIFLLGFSILLLIDNKIALSFGIILLLISQYNHLKVRWIELFGPLKILHLELPPITEKNQPITIEKIDRELRNAINKEKKNNSAMKNSLVIEVERYVVYSEVITALDAHVKDILNSKSYLKHLVVKSFYSLLFAVVIFGGVNYGLFKINPANYKVGGESNLFNFMYYSFFTIFSEGVDIDPVSQTAKAFRMLGVFIGAFINFLILAVYFTVVNEKYKQNLKGLTSWTTIFTGKMNEHMKKKHNRDGEQNKHWLKAQGSDIANHIESVQRFFRTGDYKKR